MPKPERGPTSSSIVVPDVLDTAATDLTGLGSTLEWATAAAAAKTIRLLATGEDEVSAAIAAVFSAHGRGYQTIAAQAARFHDQFVQTLTASSGAYASTDTSAVAALAAYPAQSIS